MKKLCSGCRKELISVTDRLCVGCASRFSRDRVKTLSVNESFYKTSRWCKLSKFVRSRYNGLDLYELLVNKRFVKSKQVHHIIPVKDDPERKFDVGNLIPVSAKTHRMIENVYGKSLADKEKMQCLLFSLLDRGML